MSLNKSKHVQISFDDLNHIRILESEQFKATETLAEECGSFVESKFFGRERRRRDGEEFSYSAFEMISPSIHQSPIQNPIHTLPFFIHSFHSLISSS